MRNHPHKITEEWRKSRSEAAAAHYFAEPEYIEYWLKRVKAKCAVAESGCWLWTGALRPIWYYAFTTYRGKSCAVHRKMYEIVHKVTLKREQFVCHSCDIRHCCNPDHLWLGSNSDNQKDASRKGRHAEIKVTHCPKGHEYTPENTKVVRNARGGKARGCKTCIRLSSERYALMRRYGITREEADKQIAEEWS